MKLFPCLFVFLVALASVAEASPHVMNTTMYQKDNSDTVVYSGEVILPEQQTWRLSQATDHDGEVRFYLLSPKEKKILAAVNKKERDREDRLTGRGQEILRNYYQILKEYADTHGNVGPISLENLDQKKHDSLVKGSTDVWLAHTGKTLPGPFAFLLPGVQFEIDARTRRVPPQNKKVLMLELQPYLDDGRQWKLYTDGSCVREEIDRDLMASYNLAIRPVTDAKGPMPEGQEPDDGGNIFTLFAVRDRKAKWEQFLVTVENPDTEEKLELTWQPELLLQENPLMQKQLDFARFLAWAPYRAFVPSSPVYQLWEEKKGWGAYTFSPGRPREEERAGRELTPFAFLGGRAAVEETLQLQPLSQGEGKSAEQTIPLASITGVEVQSHPFATMLTGEPVEGIALADFVPLDHLFVYSPKPSAILPFLDDGARFMAKLGGILQANSIDYDLKDRYLSRLGLNSKWLQTFLESGVVKESAFIFPDVFFIEGTDVTVVSRLLVPRLLGPLLQMVGVGSLSDEGIFTRTLDDGRKVLWALRGDILVISTSPREMESVLALQANNGQGSLGKSAEFGYMLGQTPVLPETRFYAYFSDPFIRCLVGPATKIGQLRRLVARQNLEKLTGGALLAKSDGYRGPMTPAGLSEAGYADPGMATGDLSIGKDGVAKSTAYGSLSELRSLGSIPLESVTEQESAAYKQYLENYNRYWRQYFDPIAIRLDDAPDGGLELTTFILPLIDNSIYNAIKDILATRENGANLKVPVTSPAPVVMFSLNLQDKGRQELTRESGEFFSRYSRINPGILNVLGPGVHFAIMDADPVIALGSGDILGAFNANSMGMARGGGMMLFPVALSVLTRPCTLYIETRNPRETLNFLRQASSSFSSSSRRRNEVDIDYYQISDREEWISSFNLFGLIKLRFGIELQGDYLVIRNIPWAPRERIEGVQEAALNGALLQTFPGACDIQLPGIFASASEQDRAAAMQGMSYLYPLVVSGHAPMQDAATVHARLFGFRPVHPGSGKWGWDGDDIVSDRYGSVREPRQPAYAKRDRNFGLLSDIDTMSINLQFEDTGLRTRLRWRLR